MGPRGLGRAVSCSLYSKHPSASASHRHAAPHEHAEALAAPSEAPARSLERGGDGSARELHGGEADPHPKDALERAPQRQELGRGHGVTSRDEGVGVGGWR